MNCENVVPASRQKFPLTSGGTDVPLPACVNAKQCIQFTSSKCTSPSLSPRGYF